MSVSFLQILIPILIPCVFFLIPHHPDQKFALNFSTNPSTLFLTSATRTFRHSTQSPSTPPAFPLSSSREGAIFHARTSTSSSSSTVPAEEVFALCTSGSLNDPDATTTPPPPRRISRTRRSRGSRICTSSSPRTSPRRHRPSRRTPP